jgi:hypothetical protein
MWCLAVSDAHSVFGNGVGGWRTYVPSSADEPERIDFREIIRNAKAGRMVMTNGPYLEVAAEDGSVPGATVRQSGGTSLSVRVQTTSWVQIDRVQILVNGRAPKELSFSAAANPEMFRRRGSSAVVFAHTIRVPLTEDAHLIAVAAGEGFTLAKGYGRSWQSAMRPVAFTNPIFVDIDGDGFQANGDTLGYPLPTGKLVEESASKR